MTSQRQQPRHPHVQPGRPPVPHDGRRVRRVRCKARNGREAGDARGKAVGQVHAEHDDDNNRYAKDDGRADPHDRESKTDLTLFCHPLSF
jgi:hypothetical protein